MTFLGACATSINFCGALGSHGKRMTIGATGRIRAGLRDAMEGKGQRLADLTLPTEYTPCQFISLVSIGLRNSMWPLRVLGR